MVGNRGNVHEGLSRNRNFYLTTTDLFYKNVITISGLPPATIESNKIHYGGND